MNEAQTHTLVVSTLGKNGRILRSELWQCDEPKGLGYPLRYSLEKTPSGVRIRDLRAREVKEISNEALEDSHFTLNDGALTLQFHHVCRSVGAGPTPGSTDNPSPARKLLNTEAPSLQTLTFTPTLAKPVSCTNLDSPEVFKKALKQVFGSLGALLIILMLGQALMPKAKEELVPAQFAKIILKQSSKSESSNPENRPKAVNLVQTFKSQKVKHSTQALLKASIVSLLAKTTPFSVTRSKKELGTLFAQNKPSLERNLAQAHTSEPQTLNVSTLVGQGTSGTGTYTGGSHAGIKGQGEVFVSLDSHDALVDEGLSKDEVGKVIHAHIAEVRYCYESAMLKNPDVQGKLIVNFVIHTPKNGSNGVIKSSKVNSSTLGDAFLDRCILTHLDRWKFPKPRGGVEVAVAYPFIFKSLGR